MEQATTTILEGYSDLEKGAYLCAIASIATADRSASEEELEYIEMLCEGAELSDSQMGFVREAAMSPMPDEELKRCLDVLKGSELRFSLVSDLIAFAEADQNYTAEEKQNVEKIASYLGVNQQQFSVLDQFTKKAVNEAPAQAQALQDGTTQPSNFLGGLGFGDKMKSAGINSSSLLKGALGIMGPILLAQMLRGGRRRRSGGMFGGGGGMMGGGMMGGGLGGMLGGGLLGGMLGGGMSRGMGGGLLGGLLGGGRGFGSTGGLFGRILGGGRF
jgi:uncharacterized tellurite resistance protein B-like protein